MANSEPRVLTTLADRCAGSVACRGVVFLGHEALEVSDATAPGADLGERIVEIPGAAFHNGTIEMMLAGDVLPDAAEGSRGFVGLAFRMDRSTQRAEVFYLRPTNGRADDQLRRNHSLQYQSLPDYPWNRLREETPGQYETYADIVPAAWHSVRAEIDGVRALFFVGGATQPSLIVNDLKLGDVAGAVGLWIGPGTRAWYRDLKVTPRP